MEVIIVNIIVISLLIGFIALGLKTLISAFIRLKKFNFYKNFTKTDGEVEGYEITKSYLDGRHHVFYYPKIKYFVNGNKYIFVTKGGDDYRHAPRVGEIIKIKYNPENPEQACKSFDSDAFLPLGVGVLCTCVEIIFLFEYLSMFFVNK